MLYEYFRIIQCENRMNLFYTGKTRFPFPPFRMWQAWSMAVTKKHYDVNVEYGKDMGSQYSDTAWPMKCRKYMWESNKESEIYCVKIIRSYLSLQKHYFLYYRPYFQRTYSTRPQVPVCPHEKCSQRNTIKKKLSCSCLTHVRSYTDLWASSWLL